MRWRTPLTLLVLLGVVVTAGWYGWDQFNDPVPDNPFAEQPRCTDERFAEGDRLPAEQVRVNVYNAGNREGLAGATMDQLRRRGFLRGSAENAPTDISVDAVAIYDRKPESAAVRLVSKQFMGQVEVFRRPDISDGVDIVVGSDYRGIDPSANTNLQISSEEDICVPPPADRR